MSKYSKFQSRMRDSREISSVKFPFPSGPAAPRGLFAALNFGAWCLALFLCPDVHAQSYSIAPSAIGGGGGTSTGGVYSIGGTSGQPDAGPAMSGSNFSLTGGFWSLLAVQTPGAPMLTVSLTSTNMVIVSWPIAGLNFQLQESTNLSLPNGWSPVSQPAVTNAGQISVTVSTTAGRKFFRLKSQ